MNVPEKHRAVAHAWVDGAEVEFTTTGEKLWSRSGPHLAWYEDTEYRIKPKAKVKKWRWVCCDGGGCGWRVTKGYYSSVADYANSWGHGTAFIEKIDSTMIEEDE